MTECIRNRGWTAGTSVLGVAWFSCPLSGSITLDKRASKTLKRSLCAGPMLADAAVTSVPSAGGSGSGATGAQSMVLWGQDPYVPPSAVIAVEQTVVLAHLLGCNGPPLLGT